MTKKHKTLLIAVTCLLLMITCWLWTCSRRPLVVDCRDSIYTIGQAVMAYAVKHDGLGPVDLQVLYDEGYIDDLRLFRCPSVRKKLGNPRKIEEWSDYRYVQPDGDISHWPEGVPMVADRMLSHHGDMLYVYQTDGVRNWVALSDVYGWRVKCPGMLPDELVMYYANRGRDVEAVERAIRFVAVREPGDDDDVWKYLLGNEGTNVVRIRIMGGRVSLSEDAHSPPWWAAKIDQTDYPMEIKIGTGERIALKDHVSIRTQTRKREDGVVQKEINVFGGAGSGRLVTGGSIAKECDYCLEVSILLNVDVGSISNLVVALFSEPEPEKNRRKSGRVMEHRVLELGKMSAIGVRVPGKGQR